MSEIQNEVAVLDSLHKKVSELKSEIAKVIVGQDKVVEQVLTAIFCNGHSLLVGVPGLAKTLLVQTLSDTMHLSFSRIQFTPDLMPSDISGSEILEQGQGFKFNKGPVFANIILADEINRTPPKTQAALLEAMQERSVTAAGQRHALPLPFFVLATQNPIEQEGTYPLPEAQLDRFMFNITLEYPSFEEEMQIVKATTSGKQGKSSSIMSAEEILKFQLAIRQIPLADNVLEYAVNLVAKTRPNQSKAAEITNKYLSWGAGPRASQFLILGAKCHAAFRNKYSPDIEDVKAVALPILRHRLVKNYNAEADGVSIDDIVVQLL
ncbi:MAG: MoxR family ATPase [Chitinophagaceae bacterium]|nr:MAG: MoxR family ATPase [Chitinophagaceae bacterium]